MRRLRTIGVRLTLWGAGITLLVALMVCVMLYLGVRYSMYRQVDNFLEEETYEFRGVVNEHPGDFASAQDAIRDHLGAGTREDLLIRVIDSNGVPLITSDPDDPLRHEKISIDDLNTDRPVFQSVHPAHDSPMRVCSLPVRLQDGKVIIVQAGYVLDRMNSSLSMVLKAAGLALLISLVLAVLAGRTLASRSLAPLHRIASTAEQIKTNRLSERLPRSNTGDEFDRLAAVLNDLLDRVEKYVAKMQQFTADASHELRSPLAALRGHAEVALSRNRSQEEFKKVLEESMEHYDRLIRITEDLLLLARIDAGEAIFRQEPVELDRAVADVVDLFAPVAAERGLSVTLHAEPGVKVVGDSGRLRQLTANLLDNAIKYTPSSGSIAVSLQRREGAARLQVIDTGVGISAEDLPKVFDRFYRREKSRSKNEVNGVGLGLAICRSIVQGHNGTITADSRDGAGTTITVDLPCATAL